MKRLFSAKTILISAIFLITAAFAGCSGSEEEPVSQEFNAELIDQHLDANVTYTERYRPQYHYTPRINWMNDPNGLVYYEGQYHLFHQYNPFGNQWGYMSWYHAVSDDLVHWEHKPVAIPYGKEQEEGIFSGSAVVDHNNTTGFGDGSRAPLVAIYTSHYTREDGSTWQAQSLAYSVDGGESFIKYEGNPVLEFDDPDFRDPNVKWNEEMGKWLMVVALPQQHKVQFYASENLTEWEFLSDFGPAGATGGIWECPDFFELPIDGDPDNKRWVLHVDMNPGSIAGGSGSQYFVGRWDGSSFTPDEQIMQDDIKWVDYGTDFYAAISWNNIPEEDGRRLWIGWMNNWSYANDIPTSPWRSAQSIPRSLTLETRGGDVHLIQTPVTELEQLRQAPLSVENPLSTDSETDLSEVREGISGKAYEVMAEIAPGDTGEAMLVLRAGPEEETLVGYDAENEVVFLDRTNSGESDFYDEFNQRFEAPARLIEGKIKLHIFIDWSSVEVFVNDGETVLTSRIFPDPESTEIRFRSVGGSSELESLTFWPLKSIWADQQIH